jgi:hypothetical protein
MKRLLSSILALALGLGSVPAQAQVALGRVALGTGISAPTPVPGGLVPAAGAFTPSLSAPALALSLTPAPYTDLTGGPVKPVQAALVPAPLAVSAIPAAPVLPESRPVSPMETLRALTTPEAIALPISRFDGAAAKASDDAEPVRVEPAASELPALDNPGAPAPKKPKKLKTLYEKFSTTLLLASVASAAAPMLWGAAPALKFTYTGLAALVVLLAIAVPLEIGVRIARKLRRAPQGRPQGPPSWKKTLAAIALGAALGAGIGAVPTVFEGPIVEHYSAWQQRATPAEKRDGIRWIQSAAVSDESVKVLSANPVGRRILDQLRDRGGVLRMPTFFISNQEDSYASHEDGYDGVYLARQQIEQRGWTVDQFLKDPALQRQLVREMQSVIAHELVHAIQGRRAPWTKGYFQNAVEHEYEAFIQQHYYVYAMVKADPAMALHGEDDDYLEAPAANLEGFLRERDGLYPKDVHVSEPGFQTYLAKVRADMPAHRVDVYMLLAERAMKQNHPGMARIYEGKAKAAAKAAGLPEPASLVVSR